jgi:hypothetical protein
LSAEPLTFDLTVVCGFHQYGHQWSRNKTGRKLIADDETYTEVGEIDLKLQKAA